MGEVEAGMMGGSEGDGEAGAGETGLFATNLRMMDDIRIVAILRLRLSHIAIDDVGILAMDHYRQRGCGKDTIQGLTTIDKHVARGRAHKKFDARDTMGIELGEEVGIVVGSTKEEAIVDVTLSGCKRKFLLQSLKGRGLGDGVGHVEIGGDTSCSSSTTLCIDIGLVSETWFTEMDVVIDDARENKTTRSVDDFIIRCFGQLVFLNNPYDFFVVNDQ